MVQATALPGAEALREMLAEDDGTLFQPVELSADQKLFLNRELSWLQFNRRVLLESADDTLPPFERLKFLSIYGTNLDEFYMVRVGGLTDRNSLHPFQGDRLTGMTPSEQLDAIAEETANQLPLLEQQYETVRRALQKQHVELLDCDRLSDVDKALVKQKFKELRPLLQPQIIERGQPLPFLRNKEIYALVLLGHGKHRAVGLVPTLHLPKYFVFHLDEVTKILPTAELVRRYAHTLFSDRKPEETALVRVTRNAEIDAGDVMDDCDADFRSVMERLLRQRRRLEPVRAQLSKDASERMVELVQAELKLPEERIFPMALPLDLSFVQKLGADVIPQSLRMQLPEPAKVSKLKKGDYFEYLKPTTSSSPCPTSGSTPSWICSTRRRIPRTWPLSPSPSTGWRAAAASPRRWPMPPARGSGSAACWSCAPDLTSRTTSTIPACWRMPAARSATDCRTIRSTPSSV